MAPSTPQYPVIATGFGYFVKGRVTDDFLNGSNTKKNDSV